MEIEAQARNPYPPPYDRVLDGRARRALGDPHGLTKFGVNLTELAPGAVSALRHWHSAEDEFIYIVSGAPTLVTDDGEQLLSPGMCACFPRRRRERPSAREPLRCPGALTSRSATVPRARRCIIRTPTW